MKWILALVLCLGLLGCSSIVGPDPRFTNNEQMEDYYEGVVTKLQYNYRQEHNKIMLAYERGEITHEEYRRMSTKILEKYSIEAQKLRDKYGESRKYKGR